MKEDYAAQKEAKLKSAGRIGDNRKKSRPEIFPGPLQSL